MSTQHDLKSVLMLTPLNDETLKKIDKITTVLSYDKGRYIFKERDRAEYLYAVIQGRVCLEININSDCPFIVKCIYPGKAFGISSVVDTEKRATVCHAKAVEPTKVFRWKGADLEAIFEQDYQQGYVFMRTVGKILKNRLEVQRVQLVEGLYNDQRICA
jgi:CRP-like cAMP-binding protein